MPVALNKLLGLRRGAGQQLVGELLSKPWIDTSVPLGVAAVVLATLGLAIDNYLSAGNFASLTHQFAETAILVLAMGIVVMSGGIDLSVGAIFALANFVCLYLTVGLEWPVAASLSVTLLMGAALGAVNGVLCGVFRLRAFLVTLITMVILRAVASLLIGRYGAELAMGTSDSALWHFIGQADILGFHVNFVVFLILALLTHVALTRSRAGAHILAVGGNRLAARRAGIGVVRLQVGVYVLSGLLCGLAGALYAARVSTASVATGRHLEIIALTAVVLGGVSLGGGRGSAIRMVLGTIIVMVLSNGMVRLGIRGGMAEIATGAILLVGVVFDVKWQKHRDKILQAAFVSPVRLDLPPLPDIRDGSASPYAANDRLRAAEVIGLGQVDGPEDVILDRRGNLYTGVRQGEIIRFLAPDFERKEVFARIGGRPLGLAFDRDDNLVVCVAGMGVYGVRPDGVVFRITDRAQRSWLKLRDDSRITMADDLDIAPDGRIFFSEATDRYALGDWIVDSLEAAGNGRILCHDPRQGRTTTVLGGLNFANGICIAHDGRSLLFNESWTCTVRRYWLEGPKAGTVEAFIDNLPGFPDNINRASNGHYWLAVEGVRSPLWDLAMRSPGMRSRMVKRIPRDEWIFPNVNAGFVARVDENGGIVDVYWDREGANLPAVTSMREHQGFLYLGGIANNRIGRLKLEGADPAWTGPTSYWGGKGQS